MEAWMKISIMLCIFGMLKEFRPSEPYITKYLMSMNFTIDEVSNSIYPISIYTTMASLILVFLLTDMLRYKPIIIFDGICAIIVFAMLLTVESIFLVQVVEVFYGLFTAGEVAYYTYIYAKVNKEHYQEVSGHTRAAYLVGRAFSGIISQLYITFSTSSSTYYNLNYITLGMRGRTTPAPSDSPSPAPGPSALPAQVPEASSHALPAQVPEASSHALPAQVPEASSHALPAQVPESSVPPQDQFASVIDDYIDNQPGSSQPRRIPQEVSNSGMVLATIWACFLPPVASSIYFGRVESPANGNSIQIPASKDNQSNFMKSIRYLALDFYAAVSNIYILKWMLWWSLATCGYYQILSYVQVLWEQVVKDADAYNKENDEWNGAVEATYTLLSALTAFSCGKVPLNWKYYGESILAVCSLIIAFLLFFMSQTNSIVIAYISYIVYTIFYNGMITIANSEIATHLNPDSHGLIFGFTTFMALVFQTILTIAVSSMDNERFKFVIYSCYFGILGITFAFIAIVKIIRRLTNNKSIGENIENENNS